jgi:hypothetical protein
MRFSTVKRLLHHGRERLWNQFNRMGEKLRETVPPALRFWLKLKREQLLAKWRKALRLDHSEQDGLPPARAVDDRPGLNVIVFDNRIPAPDWDAGSARMSLILKSLTKLGRPVFISMSKFQRPEYVSRLTKEGVEVMSWIDYQRLLNSRRFQVALLSRADVAGALLRSVKRVAPMVCRW